MQASRREVQMLGVCLSLGRVRERRVGLRRWRLRLVWTIVYLLAIAPIVYPTRSQGAPLPTKPPDHRVDLAARMPTLFGTKVGMDDKGNLYVLGETYGATSDVLGSGGKDIIVSKLDGALILLCHKLLHEIVPPWQ